MQSVFVALLLILAVGCQTNAPKDSETKVIGGTLAELGEAPYVIQILDLNCTATVVSTHHILTAAHCVTSDGPTISLPSTPGKTLLLRRELGSAQIPVKIKNTVIHPQWTAETGPYTDLAVIETTAAIPFPVADISYDVVEPGSELVIYGFGCEELGGPGASKLRKGKILVTTVEDAVLIAETNSPAHSCSGDSGGGIFRVGQDGSQAVVAVTHAHKLNAAMNGVAASYYMRVDGPAMTPPVKNWIIEALGQ